VNKLMRILKDNRLLFDVINVMLGIAIIILVILIMMYPYNKYIRLAAFSVGGLMNISNGLKYLKDSKKKSMGMNLIMVGVFVIIVGVVVTKMK